MIHVTPLKDSDHERWLQLWSEYQRFYGVDLPAEATQYTWQRLHDGRIHGLGARTASGDLVGIVHFLFHADTWSTASACYLEDLYVDPVARGTGCGRKLIEAVAAASQKAGANPPYWLTHQSNTVARRLYDRVAQNPGFIQYIYAPTAAGG